MRARLKDLPVLLAIVLINLAAWMATKLIYDYATYSVVLNSLERVRNLQVQVNPQSQVIVAVIDTGIDETHPELKEHLWKNLGEVGYDSKGRLKSENGIDDDGNGFKDDVHGWDFTSSTSEVEDHHGHGTHIAGLVVGVSQFQVQQIADNSKIKLMVLKYYDPRRLNRDAADNTAKAIRYAVDNGAHIINYSSGGAEPSESERQAILYALKQNVLIVAAAGNDGLKLGTSKFYPASYRLPNVLSVANSDKNFNPVKSSNYSERFVDVAAYGHRLDSTLPHGKRGYMTGTSQATAVVSWMAAHLISSHPFQGNFVWVRNVLKNSGRLAKSWQGRTETGRVALPENLKLAIKNLNKPQKNL